MNALSKTLKNWWILLVLGIAFIFLSIWIFRTPLASYVSLALVFSILIFADGLAMLIFSISNWNQIEGRGWYLASAIITFLIGIILLAYPGLSLATLPFVVGFWLLFRSIAIISSAIEFRGYKFSGWGWVLFTGILLLILSFMIIMNPIFGALYVVTYTALALLMLGIGQIWLAFQLRKIKGETLDKIEAFRDSLRTA